MTAADPLSDLAPVETSAAPGIRFRGEGSWFSHKLNVLWVDDALEEDEPLDHVVAHELSHFYAHVSTPYGYLLDSLHSLEVGAVLLLCRATVAEHREQVLVPAYDLAQRLLSGSDIPPLVAGRDAELRDLIDRYVRPWSQHAYLEAILEGEEGEEAESVREATMTRAWELLAAAEAAEADLTPDEKLFRETGFILDEVPPRADQDGTLNHGDRKACLLARFHDGRTFPVGGLHVFEGLAVDAERAGPETLQWLIRDHPEYVWLWLKTVEQFGKQVTDEHTFHRLRNTFVALCDLALFVPAGVVYGRLRPEGATWLDIQPYIRFLRGLDAVQHVGWVDDRASDLEPFQDAICARLGWPRPRAFLELGQWLEWRNDDTARHAEACKLRLERPALFLEEHDEPDPALTEFVTRYLPPLRHPRHDSLVVRRHAYDVNLGLNAVIPYFLAEFSWDVMKEGRLDYAGMFPAHVDWESLFPSDPLGPRSMEDFLEVVLEGMPYLAAHNFRRFDA